MVKSARKRCSKSKACVKARCKSAKYCKTCAKFFKTMFSKKRVSLCHNVKNKTQKRR